MGARSGEIKAAHLFGDVVRAEEGALQDARLDGEAAAMAAVIAIAEVVGGEDQALGDMRLQAGEEAGFEDGGDALAEGLGQSVPVGRVGEAEMRDRRERA